MSDFTVIIPLRIASDRLKGKPLLKLNGEPLFVHIYNNLKSKINSLFIATSDVEILEECTKRKIRFIKTSSRPRNGSERVAEAITNGKIKSNIIIDLQGDEIDADYKLISGVINTLIKKDAEVCTAVAPLQNADRENKDIVKAVLNKDSKCIYFTRAPIPYFRYSSKLSPSIFRHIGIYCYKRDTLLKYKRLPPTYLEECESLEQMRFIENGIDIYAFVTNKQYCKIDNVKEYQKIRGIKNDK
ncbi:MAG: 3-deoxy-manno-octulosonate cytidylyltransferase [Deltaproteobacteria bacterium]|nr:3-deoxy-manno-octulosonate cytidylyltransferase [Deltaproteobacteria bacterium]